MKLIPGNYYAITINPLTKHLVGIKRYDELDLLEQRKFLEEKLDILMKSGDVLDIGFEFTKAGNYHVHFTFRHDSECSIFEKTLQTLLGFSPREILIKEIFNVKGWVDYAQKDQPLKPAEFLF